MTKLKLIYARIKRFVPAIAFLGGFGWDSFTLGKLVQSSDLLILGVYFIIAYLFLILLSASKEAFPVNKEHTVFFKCRAFVLSRNLSDSWKYRFSYVVQFCFGSLFSALVVCYFKSSGDAIAFIFVAILTVLLICNEFLQKSYEKFGLTLALFSLIGAMFLNFLIPHLVFSIHFIWFFISVLITFALCVLASRMAHKPKKTLLAPLVISLVLILARLLNWIAPVPLVLKEQMACTGFKKDYSCEISVPDFFVRKALKKETVYLKESDGGVYFLSSVFAPEKVSAKLEHRWYSYDVTLKKFVLTDKISSNRMVTKGSREEGFRIYTKKKKVSTGIWKVETAVENGAVIGSKTFNIELATSTSPERQSWQMK